jgi:hypothetical protein
MPWPNRGRAAHIASWAVDGSALHVGLTSIDERIDVLNDVERGVVSPEDLPVALNLDERYGDLYAQLHRPTRFTVLFSRDGSAYRRGPKPDGTVWACVLLPGRDLLSIGAAGWIFGIAPDTISSYVHREATPTNLFPKPASDAAGARLWRRGDLFTWHSRRPGNGHYHPKGS